jgi:3-oxoadipate enol-lactonase / 4-carboxymuconolactone decarboxylase
LSPEATRRPEYRLEGPSRAPVLVLSNGLGTTASMWDPHLADLTQFFRVLRYEHPGHGGSPAPAGPYTVANLGGDLLSVLDQLELDTVSFVGISLGGMVGMWLAAAHPQRVERLVLCCTAPRLGTPESWNERATTVRHQGVASIAELLFGRWFTAPFRQAHPEVLVSFATMLASTDAEGYACCCEAIGEMDLTAELERISAPTLVVAGAADPVVPPELALGLQQKIAGSGLVVIAGAAHLANIAPDASEFSQLVLAHLLGSAPARGLEVRREVLGASYVERAMKNATPLTAQWQSLITRYAWGEIWARPGLDRTSRRLLTLGMLIALGRLEEFELHLRAALGDGVSPETVREVLLHSAIYAGVPAANSAFRVVSRVLAEKDLSEGEEPG